MDPYIGEIRLFAGKYAPAGWYFCNGQTLQVVAHQTLFTVIGNMYGGDGKTTFALPDMRGMAPIHQGNGAGLTPRPFLSTGGTNQVTLTERQMPFHDHAVNCQTTANENNPNGAIWANEPRGARPVYSQTANTPMSAQAIGTAGGGKPHNNMQPYAALNFIIAAEGVYPSKP
ncbi:phage tail protein [Paenibacillus flagellatus]|uniref:Phage tail protein n=1 Tax=Paenibacillus flagellatus TaxID=2211139 RepID=A0A2V5L1D0_9BACL|nr:tail fiber protein [Paenibacillus flagellatus]PYI56516.1 phage tail protein [Paenibacillus flagellatus]